MAQSFSSKELFNIADRREEVKKEHSCDDSMLRLPSPCEKLQAEQILARLDHYGSEIPAGLKSILVDTIQTREQLDAFTGQLEASLRRKLTRSVNRDLWAMVHSHKPDCDLVVLTLAVLTSLHYGGKCGAATFQEDTKQLAGVLNLSLEQAVLQYASNLRDVRQFTVHLTASYTLQLSQGLCQQEPEASIVTWISLDPDRLSQNKNFWLEFASLVLRQKLTGSTCCLGSAELCQWAFGGQAEDWAMAVRELDRDTACNAEVA